MTPTRHASRVDLPLPGGGENARRRFFWSSSDLAAGAFLIAVAALVIIPLVNLVRIALSGESDVWADLVAYVIPEALRVTVLLLGGVAALTAIIGTGAAWLVTAYRFPAAIRSPGRSRCRSRSRPISSPTCM